MQILLTTAMRFIACLLSLLWLLPGHALALDDFAAQLLCETMGDECVEIVPVDGALPPLVVGGVALPGDAARGRDGAQLSLVRQGAYIRSDGAIVSLSSDPVTVTVPDRGILRIEDHGPAALVPEHGPVVITVPAGRSGGLPDE